ncbi:hypothetical protein T265_04241 [Opisthorchis viverrini]|uniref:Uncharacterized protein n=1 Tax=Opisthorchis viverrini TaxID=6198 RepID=A0A075A0H5_OPIVI|nr:hypothetical protein T265_04241 [Opisthorchis viverrini]KER29055.1 hypothetical protein T265_04241 [Opisthorchis viverrini]
MLRWLGHMLRMPVDRLSRRAPFAQPCEVWKSARGGQTLMNIFFDCKAKLKAMLFSKFRHSNDASVTSDMRRKVASKTVNARMFNLKNGNVTHSYLCGQSINVQADTNGETIPVFKHLQDYTLYLTSDRKSYLLYLNCRSAFQSIPPTLTGKATWSK